jgi:hypothetical protein
VNGSARARPYWDARYTFLGAIAFIILGGILGGILVAKASGPVSKQWRRHSGAYAVQVVVDPNLAAGGIDGNYPSLETILAKEKHHEFTSEDFNDMMRFERESPNYGLGSVSSREGPTHGSFFLCIWDVKGPFPAEGNGTAHVVALWLEGLGSGSTNADAQVTWFEESRTVSGTLDDLKGTVRINRAVASSDSLDGKNPFVIEYDLTGFKSYKGVSTEMRANNKVTFRL